MENYKRNKPISLRQFKSFKGFWQERMELVRKEMIPYQWETLNDRVEGARPSFCVRNFRLAGKLMQEKREMGADFVEPVYTYRGFEALPEDMEHIEDKFYGYVFQDSDLYKWIEAVGHSLANHPDEELENLADEAIDLVCAAQLENGYLDTHYILNGMDKHFTNLRDHHELYCFGHLTEAAIAYYQATGKDKLLQAAIRFADYIDSYFGPEEGKCKGYPGHQIAEMALVRLFEVTGERKYLNLSKFFIDERGKFPYYWDGETEEKLPEGEERYHHYQAHKPTRQQDEAVGHAVRALYFYSGIADVARATEDEELREVCKTLWNSVVHEKMYITGAVGGTRHGEAFSFPFDLPNDTAYAETCASIALVFFARRMLEAEINSEYADVMELALYNSVLSGMDLDGKKFFYVNPLEVLPEACHKDVRKSHVKPVRQKWFGCACCPPNLARMISSVPAYAYTETEDTLWMHLHMDGEVSKKVVDKTASFAVKSGMPWNGNVTVRYTGEDDVNMKLAVRIPGWCERWHVRGNEKFHCVAENGYYYIEGIWTKDTVLDFEFEMEVAFYQADSRIRENIGKLAVMKGPVVFCAEEVDNGKNLHLYEVAPECEVTEEMVEICGCQMPMLKVGAYKKEEMVQMPRLYAKYRRTKEEPTELKMIPYFAWANRGENEMKVWFEKY